MTTKGLRHMTIRENAIRESVDNKFIKVMHVSGKTNLADMFTKEMKDTNHFINLRNLIVSPHVLNKRATIPLPSSSVERGVLEHTARP